MTSPLETQSKDDQGPTPGAEKVKEGQSQDQVLKSHHITKGLDLGRMQETNLPREDSSLGHILGNKTAKDMFQNPDHAHIQTVSLGPDHLDTQKHIPGLEGNLLFLGISESFHPLIGEEVLTLLEEGQVQDLIGHVQKEGVLRGGDSHIPDLTREEDFRDLSQDLGEGGHVLDQDHVYEIENLAPNLEEGETDLGQDLPRTQQEEVDDQRPEEGKEVKAVLGQNQDQKRRLSPTVLYQFPVLIQR